ncbi:MAG: RagB/SusD family nutrient uptake outer membrane protein, partial [Ferruginibacter sp.]|nr:RagB/SusD family nutrient uptake outer membrane protein [Ferruginibacter sp.]
NGVTTDIQYATFEGYQSAYAKVYGSFALTGNQGPAGNGDVQGIDEGTSDFLRLYWWVQEISTDEAVVQAGWNDPGIHFFHPMNWTTDNVITKGVYYRAYYQITLANEFIRQSADDKLAVRGITGANAAEIKTYAQEARFLRAFQYSVLIDLFGNVPFVTEADIIGAGLPRQILRSDLFNYIETELKDLETKLPAVNGYGRARKNAATALLARIYLNAEIYTGTPKYNEAASYASQTLGDGFSLIPDYRQLMLADNQTNTSEVIMSINYDGIRTQSYGGTTFLTHAPVGGSMAAASFGIAGGWSGIRTTSRLPGLFADVTGATDRRAQFYTNGQTLNLTAEPAPSFTEGYAVTKFRNVKKDGTQGSSPDFSDIDFPIFRSAELNLIYAEAVLRGATTGDVATALNYVNALRTRAYGDASGNITASDLTLDFIIDERGRELYWEGFRRTDLIRFGRFTEGTYLWPWKGGVSSGTSVASFRKLFPIPNTDINSNSNLVQNPGY